MMIMFDERQQELIDYIKGGEPYILVEAPAGTGKTFCCIQAAKTLCDANMLLPFQKVLVLTFSRNARAQLLKELSKLPRESAVHKQIDINNYHSFFKKYLDVYRDILGIHSPLIVTDDDDYIELLYSYAATHDVRLANGLGVSIIDDYCIEGDKLLLINSESKHKKKANAAKSAFLACATQFTRETGHICFAQFGNLVCQILSASGQMANAISHDYPVLILDEYQDTNYLQEKFVSKILETSKGIFFADKWQMIYAFRGSSTERISMLSSKYPSLKTVGFSKYYRYENMHDIVDILNSIRGGQAPDYSTLTNGMVISCQASCDSNWQVLSGTSHKAQCTSFSKAIFYSIIREVTALLKQNKSVLILCRHNNVANRLSEVFFENNLHPRSVSDTAEMSRICKHIKRCIEPGTVQQNIGSILVIAALCTMSKKIDGEDTDALFLLGEKELSRKRKPLLKQIYSLIAPFQNTPCVENGLRIVSEIVELLRAQESVFLNYSRQRYVEHCIKVKDLTPTLVDHIMMQRQYIDSFTNITPGLYVTTVHQAKGKEFDCVFVIDIDDIANEPNLMYVANSRMKERLYPVNVKYAGVPYNR